MQIDHERPEPAETDRLLDQLVDGELSDEQRRSLLLWCQQDSEGWRRCALAFLEAQTWKHALPAAREPEEPAVVALPSSLFEAGGESVGRLTQARPRRWGSLGAWGGPLAMAASFLLAFTLGLAMNGRTDGPDSIIPQPEAPSVAQSDGVPNETQLPVEAPALETPSGRSGWGNVRLVVDGGAEGTEEIQLPVVEGNALDHDWLNSQPAPMPADVQRALERLGGRVEQHRRLVPIRLKDGRRLVVPVDEVEVLPVNRSYQ